MAIGAISTPFPSCCGSTILHAFGVMYTDPKHIWSKLTFVPGHVYFAILREQQRVEFEKTLLDSRFRLVSDQTVNKNSANRLYVYIRDPETPKPKPVTKSIFGDK